MFIRKKRNKSGSTSVHIVRKVEGRQVHVLSIGTADNEEELVKLEQEALVKLSSLQLQNSFEFGYAEDQAFIKNLQSSIDRIEVSGVELILGKLFSEIGFNQIKEPLFRHLVLSRICYPGSKLKTVEYLMRHHQLFYEIDAVYRYLDKVNSKYKELLQDISYQHTLRLFEGQISVVFYDVTTLYFEASDEDDLRKIGFSKDGKSQNPQIVLGLLASTEGYPLAFEMFEGNKFEGQTMLPIIEKFKARYDIQQIVIIADAGLLSHENIEALCRLHYKFILGARIKNEPKSLQQQLLACTWHNGQTHTINKADGVRLIVSYSEARAYNDNKNRERGLRRLEKSVQRGKLTKKHINNRGYNKYLQLNGEVAVSIDYEKIHRDKKWDGLKGYITNTEMTPTDVINNYKQLWHIEKAFRISKTDLRIRPIYHRLAHRIQAHLIIAFCSYKLYKELERQLKEKKLTLSAEKAVAIMQSIFTVNTKLPASGKSIKLIMAKTDEQQQLLNAFNINF
ncbi:MAG: IS1634 family transposase [Bacteroidetes bacterium]|nr:IS1634 family transposase [Bacteroidota bacterium]